MTVSAEDLQMLADTAREWVSANAPARAGLGRDPALGVSQWRGVAEMGWAGAAVPEEAGGAGFGFAGLGALLGEIGREIADIPLLASGLAALLVARFGSDGARQETLPGLISGEKQAALAIGEGAHHGGALSTTATRTAGGWVLNGRKSWVQGAASAAVLLVAAQGDMPMLFLVDARAVRHEAIDSVDGRAFAHVILDNVTVSDDALMAGGTDTVARAVDLARIGLAAEMVGACERAIEITVDYLKTREQFGRKIGSFQALQHRAAQMLVDLELARSSVQAALAAADEDRPDLEEWAILAKYMAGEAIHLASSEMVQLHGGIGMTSEHVAGNYIKWARVSEALLGGNALLAERYATIKGY